MFLGARYYFWLRRQDQPKTSFLQGAHYAVLLGCLAGAALGNKLVFWIDQPQLWTEHGTVRGFLLGGQSMVGGLVGGLIGVELGKWISRTQTSTGDYFVYPILLGLIVGRMGCFLSGLNDDTFGNPTQLWTGIDFGDGIARHPTQLYEMAFAALLWFVLRRYAGVLRQVNGLQFKVMFSSYLLWRFGIDAIKPVHSPYLFGLSGIQWVCLISLCCYAPFVMKSIRLLRLRTS